MHHNNKELFHLPQSSPRQRIVAVFGNKYHEQLVPVEEETNLVVISGFVKENQNLLERQKGEQYFFVNKRFIKSGYLHHAVTAAFEESVDS